MAFLAASCALLRAAILARSAGSAMRLLYSSRLVRRMAAVRHSCEQYRDMWLAATNSLPHSPHFTLRTLAIDLSALALHWLQ